MNMDEFLSTLLDALAGGWSKPIGSLEVFVALCMAALIGLYIYIVYILMTRRTFYSKDFNITLACVTLITAGLVSAIQSSLLVTLSVGGALSIIRFRTAIKSPIDLMFLFWGIAAGIMCGTGVGGFAMMLSVFLTVMVVVLSKLPLLKAPQILIINAKSYVDTKEIKEAVSKSCSYYSIKSESRSFSDHDMSIELRSKDTEILVKDLSGIRGVESVSVLEHNGDVSF